MAIKPAKTLYNDLTVYERTFIETFQAIVASGNYAPGPLVMDMARDAAKALVLELGYALPVATVDFDPQPHVWTVWNN